MKREEMIKALQENICKVVFTKANGEERVMEATLLKEWVEPTMVGKETSGRAVNLDVIPVIDTQKEEWRSFRVDSVKEFVVGI